MIKLPDGVKETDTVVVAEAARLLGYSSPNTLYPYVHSGELRTIHVGRFYYTTWRDLMNCKRLTLEGRGHYQRRKKDVKGG